MAEAFSSVYGIDDVAVNSYIGWDIAYLPGPVQGRREETYPGIPQRFGVSGQTLPPDLIITGRLFADAADKKAAFTALIALVKAENDKQNNGSTYKVNYFTEAFENCQLIAFQTTGKFYPLQIPGGGENVRLAVDVEYRWRQLQGDA